MTMVDADRTSTRQAPQRFPVRFNERLCMWSMVPAALFIGAGLFLSGFIPPPNPDTPTAELVTRYLGSGDRIRMGITLLSVGAVFLVTFGVAMAAAVRRIEGQSSTMATLVLITTVFTGSLTTMYCYVVFAATYRPDRDPQLLQLLSDFFWLPFIGMWQPGALQAIAVGLAVIGDPAPGRPGHLPRWVGWFSFWYAFTSLVGAFVPFAWTGALAWSGFISFYLGAVSLVGFWVVLSIVILLSTRTRTTAEALAQESVL